MVHIVKFLTDAFKSLRSPQKQKKSMEQDILAMCCVSRSLTYHQVKRVASMKSMKTVSWPGGQTKMQNL